MKLSFLLMLTVFATASSARADNPIAWIEPDEEGANAIVDWTTPTS